MYLTRPNKYARIAQPYKKKPWVVVLNAHKTIQSCLGNKVAEKFLTENKTFQSVVNYWRREFLKTWCLYIGPNGTDILLQNTDTVPRLRLWHSIHIPQYDFSLLKNCAHTRVFTHQFCLTFVEFCFSFLLQSMKRSAAAKKLRKVTNYYDNQCKVHY